MTRKLNRARTVPAAAIALVAWVACASPALAEQRWRLDSISNTAVAAGGTLDYIVQATNVGDTAMDGSEVDLIARLPVGMRAVSASVFAVESQTTYPCTAGDGSPVVDATEIRCVDNEPVPAPGGFTNFEVLNLTVAVDAGAAAGTLTSAFTVSGGGAPASGETVDPVTVVSAGTPLPLGFGVDAFDGAVLDASGNLLMQAGAHPDEQTVSIDFATGTDPLKGSLWPAEPVKDIDVQLPPGQVGDPTAADTCTATQLSNTVGIIAMPLCPSTSQVGTTLIRANTRGANISFWIGPLPIFNMQPPPGVPARFGFNALGSLVMLDASLRTGGDYGLSVTARNVPEALTLIGSTIAFWGVPASPSHDAERACPGGVSPADGGATCRSGAPLKAFLRNPTSCPPPGVGLPTTLLIDSWFDPGDFTSATYVSHELPGYPFAPSAWGAPVGTTGCERVPFDPSLQGTPTNTRVASPSGFSFDVSLPQNSDPNQIGEGDLKRATVTLPEGMHVSASSAHGLAACSPEQIRLHDATSPDCPDAAKLGSVTVETPLLARPLEGAVYLASPHDNPFGTLLSLYLVAEGSGVVVKLAGRIDADPVTGQLTTTFDDNPQTPFSKLHLQLDGGPTAPLALPRTCGAFTTRAQLESWSGKVVDVVSTFSVDGDDHGGPCPPPRFSPSFTAETTHPIAGATSTFNLALARDDADQQLGRVTVDMPEGLTAKIANATLCSDAQAQAGNCPESSRVGRVTVGAGAGPDPFYIDAGRAYLTGPYKGAPYGLAIVVPAVAGPFNLGDVVVRSSIFVDKHDATVRVVSDVLPTILQGIPLDVRDVRVSVDKPNFFLNPTSCARKTIAGKVESTEGSDADVSSSFQVGECERLAFTPRMAIRVGGKGHTHRGATTPLVTTLRMPSGGANLRSVRVSLPTTINARLTVINDACTRDQFEHGDCQDAKAGTAVAVTPLLRDPLRGNAYFVKNGHAIPDLFIALRGQVDFDLIGRITIPGSKHLATTFDHVPDVPVRSFTLRLAGDRKNGSVGAATNLCSSRGRRGKAQLDYVAQNGKVRHVRQALKIGGCKAAGHGRRAKRHRG